MTIAINVTTIFTANEIDDALLKELINDLNVGFACLFPKLPIFELHSSTAKWLGDAQIILVLSCSDKVTCPSLFEEEEEVLKLLLMNQLTDNNSNAIDELKQAYGMECINKLDNILHEFIQNSKFTIELRAIYGIVSIFNLLLEHNDKYVGSKLQRSHTIVVKQLDNDLATSIQPEENLRTSKTIIH